MADPARHVANEVLTFGPVYCSFCGRHVGGDGGYIGVSGPSVYICENCTDEVVGLVDSAREERDKLDAQREAFDAKMPIPYREDEHRRWALENVRRVENDISLCSEHPDHMQYANCVVCAYHHGRAVGQMQAGAYLTHDEAMDGLRATLAMLAPKAKE